MYHPQINSVQIKIVGLLGDFSKKDAAIYQKKLIILYRKEYNLNA